MKRQGYYVTINCVKGIVQGSVWATSRAEAEQKARAVFKYTIYRLGGEA